MDIPTTTRGRLLRVAIIVLALGTALTHISLLFPDPVFILNGLGYLGLLAALYGPLPWFRDHRRQVRWALIGYTALTIALWVGFGLRTPVGYLNKLNEVLLIAALLLEGRNTPREDH